MELVDLGLLRQRLMSQFKEMDFSSERELPAAFKALITSFVSGDHITYYKYTVDYQSSSGLKIYFPNQWVYIAAYFTEYLLMLRAFREEVFSIIESKVDSKDIKNIIDQCRNAETGNEFTNKFFDEAEYHGGNRDLLIRFLSDYKWWGGGKTIDRGDYYVSPVLSMAGLVNVSQNYVADLCAYLADNTFALNLLKMKMAETFNRKKENQSLANLSLTATLKSYFPIIRAKPFLLLAGISGTGKSRIVKEMAFASCPDVTDLRKDDVAPGNYLLVEVKPNWHDSTELMGYESSIKQSYVLTPFVKFLYKAMRYPEVPFFVCLDEMNLAPVEQYFAEFLSVLESRKRLDNGEIISEPLIPADIFRKYPVLEKGLLLGETKADEEKEAQPYNATEVAANYRSKEYAQLCEYGLRIPQNLIVVGTVNMDETTHQFSRKVIDRAMTIEMNEVNFDDFFETNKDLGYVNDPLSADLFLPKFTTAKQALEGMPEDAEYVKKELPEKLKKLNKSLDNTPFKIAYRVQNELVLYLAALREEKPEDNISALMDAALDDIMLMKVLPRIEGDGELLETPLAALHDFAENLPKSRAKIEEMQARLDTGHFTSFWP